MECRRITDHKILSLQDYLDLSPERKAYADYVLLSDLNNWRNEEVQHTKEHRDECYRHFKRLDNRKWIDRGSSFIGGFIGGFVAMTGWLLLQWESLRDNIFK